MTSHSVFEAVTLLANAKRISLPPGWEQEFAGEDITGEPGDIVAICRVMGWPLPVPQTGKPRPEQLPVLLHTSELGWVVAEQWASESELRFAGRASPEAVGDDALFFELNIPDPAQTTEDVSAWQIFWRAIMKRRSVLVAASLATVTANILALVTSLYSMQVFDRVIPLASYSTLIVLSVGTLVALCFDFLLRTIRALMIEREAAEIDFEVSEFFFSRSQAIRMDGRPAGVGTLAAQLRGLDQVRAVMSSGSLFLIADLPFALFFIVVILWIGGPVAYVPVISLPIALGLAFLLARLIKKGTEQAQVSGNRKNGLLVESLDAVETVKASRGEWYLLGRWNRLVREVHNYEDPVKRTSAVAQSIFAVLQQVSYVGIMAVGAYEVGEGNMTSGALLACSIIGGRVNGPLIAQLPSLIVQWGYAKSSLQALDAIITLPTEQSGQSTALKPSSLKGPIVVDGVRFAYPNAREGIEIERLMIGEGARLAVIGGIGSGKTTLLRILSGLYQPKAGFVRIAGLDMAQISSDALREHIGYLPQDYRLVNGTLRDNLLLGLGSLADDVVLAAAAKTGLDQTIASHELGLDLPIQEGGRGLSGGQRTLVGLTRLLLINPRVWILDEPTSNLDPNSEARFMSILRTELSADQTLVVVTHKLQLLSNFDRIMLMARGKIALEGPRDEVLMKIQGGAGQSPPAKVHNFSRTTS